MTKNSRLAVFTFILAALPIACTSQVTGGAKCASTSECACADAAECSTPLRQSAGEATDASVSEQACAKAAECGMLDGQTQEECVDHEELGLKGLRERSGCDGAAEALIERNRCGMKLSCDELKDLVDNPDHTCNAAINKLPEETRQHCLGALY